MFISTKNAKPTFAKAIGNARAKIQKIPETQHLFWQKLSDQQKKSNEQNALSVNLLKLFVCYDDYS